MNCIKRNIPNAITCLNVVSGTFAVLAALHGNAPWWGLTALQWAWILVGVAAVADWQVHFLPSAGSPGRVVLR